MGFSKLCGVALLALGTVMACSGGGDDDGRSGGSVWAPTTVPYDPTCANCTEIGTTSFAHMGEVLILKPDGVNDELSQWGKCVNGLLDCIEGKQDESACVKSSACPAACKNDYQAHLDALGRSDFQARWDSLRAVFMTPTSRCAVKQ
jgi:hypothetical protein